MDPPPSLDRPCALHAGDVAELLGDGWFRHPDGTICALFGSHLEEGVGFRIYYEDKMDPVALPAAPVEAPAAVGADTPAAPVEAPAAPTPAPDFAAVTAAPDPTTAAGELQGLVGAAGGDSTLAIILALIAVLGGGSAFKLYQKRAEQAHELKLKELDAKAPTSSPPPCVVKHGELETRIQAVEAQADYAAKRAKAAGLPAGFDPDALEDRVLKLEKAAKAKGRA